MQPMFGDRIEAGQRIAARLAAYRGRHDLAVLGVARGGVIVAQEIARELHARLDVVVVRKLGLPGEEEVAFGAIAGRGVRVLNRSVVADFELSSSVIDRVVSREQRELERREEVYRAGREALSFRGQVVVLVDDGIATGSTMRAAMAVVQEGRPSRLIVAAPVVAREAYLELRGKVDELVALHIPKEFSAVGSYYLEFSPVSDEAVCEALATTVA